MVEPNADEVMLHFWGYRVSVLPVHYAIGCKVEIERWVCQVEQAQKPT
ncbi:MAG: hypothetical protein ACK8QZ_01080 [Anaerolineales bacterium]